MGVLGSTGGSYVVQTVVHSLVIAIVVESLLQIWGLRRPAARLRFRLLVLAMPVVAWPLFTLAYSPRSTPGFRDGVGLLNLNRWLGLKLGAGFEVWHIFLFFIGVTTLFFVAQEVIPWLRHQRFRREGAQPVKKGQFPRLDSALAEVARVTSHQSPKVYLAAQAEPVAYIVGLTDHALVISESLVQRLDDQELKGVLAHEMAHLIRRDNWLSWVLLAVRTLMFYNPVALLAFRAIARDGEKVCDDLAVACTRQPLALASGLVKVFRAGHRRRPEDPTSRDGWLTAWAEALDDRAQQVIVEDRVRRLMRTASPPEPPHLNLRLGLTAASLAALTFFIA